MTTTSMPTNPEYQASDAAPPPSPPLDSRLVHDTKNLLATFHHRRSQLPDEQRIYIVAYGSAVPPPPESPPKPRKKRAAKKQKKNATTGTLDEPMVIDSTPELPLSPPQAPEPEVPRDPEQYVLLRREYTGVGRDTRYYWDLPQMPPNMLHEGFDVRNNSAVDTNVHNFLGITLSGKLRRPQLVPDEHLVCYSSTLDSAHMSTPSDASAASRGGMDGSSQPEVLAKYKVIDYAPELPNVRAEILGAYRWWKVEELRQGMLEGLADTDRACALKFADTGFWLGRYPKVIEEVGGELGLEAETGVDDVICEMGGQDGKGGRKRKR